MKQLLAITLMGTVLGGSALLATSVHAGPNCTCRHAGGEVAEGQSACIKTPKGMSMARCERVLNNTSWKMLDMPCPYSQVPTAVGTKQSYALFLAKDIPAGEIKPLAFSGEPELF